MTDVQEIVAEKAEELVRSGGERGLQVAAYVDGRPVVEVTAGVADPATGRRVEPGTLFSNWSIGKGATATLVHRLVDDGTLTYDTRVAEVWPEFAAHGKDAVTVRQALDHSAGVPGLPAGVTVDDVCDWSRMVAALEQAEPWWEPGTAVGYHAYTFGFLNGEIARRASGRELADLLGDLTTAIGFPGEIRFGTADTSALAVLEDAPMPETADFTLPEDMLRAVPMALFPTAALGADPRILAADIPAGAKVSARGIARMYAGWLDGTVVSRGLASGAYTESSSGTDRVYGNPSRWGLGFGLGLPWDQEGTPRVFGMAGAGGTWAGADPDRGVAVAVTRNVMSMDFETVRVLVTAVLDAVR
ncbi:beta-lactamase family protein [Pseudonocardia sp. RS11V-5]|uniref:serine hydrolase domain-containing protein n=1 Tax=Pseudonocardia terrae TaxID=2905831 RepID=UPI001E43AD60|nr:serine hydrolase domain-containing protein [Pseudonocardia terrae]MCE3555240.1 beta-lactamase family protein [Pseudonocardia terrae]